MIRATGTLPLPYLATMNTLPLPKAVVFDFGGVMTLSDRPHEAYALAREHNIAESILTEGFSRYRKLMDGGFITPAELYGVLLADAGIDVAPDLLQALAYADLKSFCTPNERTRAWMAKLRGEGFKIGILTNMPTQMASLFRRIFAGFVECADAMVVSGEVKMFKPQPCIFRLIRDKLHVEDRDILFVDDAAENCEAARSLGWRAIQFRSNEQTETEFDSWR